MIRPNSWLGLLGGGQLGKMFAMKAQQMGYRVMIVDPSEHAPAKGVANLWLCAEYSDFSALEKMVERCDAVTTEFENVPAQSLGFLEKKLIVSPGKSAVEIIQDRILEKEFLRNNGFRTVPYTVLKNVQDLSRKEILEDFFPGFLKVSKFGYDGKGQVKVRDKLNLEASFKHLGQTPCVLEEALELHKEISVVIGRSADGQVVCYPVVENKHENGILDISVFPADISQKIKNQATEITIDLAEKLQYVGVLCVEFFLHRERGLFVNEVAPRPHNSGHYTMDAFVVCQFEQQVRALCRLPLGPVRPTSPSAVMVNILGDLWQSGDPDWSKLLNSPATHFHLYGKEHARPGRKMGHYTVVAETAIDAKKIAMEIKQTIISG